MNRDLARVTPEERAWIGALRAGLRPVVSAGHPRPNGHDAAPMALTLPEKLALARRRLGWNQGQAAEKIGTNRATYAVLEREGSPRVAALYRKKLFTSL